MPRPRKKTQKGVTPGWRKSAVLIPEVLESRLLTLRESIPGATMRELGTAAFALFAGLPREVELELYDYAQRVSRDPASCDPQRAMNIVGKSFDAELRARVEAHVEDIIAGMNPDTPISEARDQILTLIRPMRRRPDGHYEQERVPYSASGPSHDAEDRGESIAG